MFGLAYVWPQGSVDVIGLTDVWPQGSVDVIGLTDVWPQGSVDVIGLADVWPQGSVDVIGLVWFYVVNMLYNWVGSCVVSGKCRCEIGFGSADCSVKYHEPPFKVELPLYGLCDRQFMKCDTVIVYGTNFVNSDTLKCHLRKCQVTRALCSLCQHCT